MPNKNIHINVIDTKTNTTAVLSSAIIVDLLRSYEKDWGNLSSQARISSVEDEFGILDSSEILDETIRASVELLNEKIGYAVPAKTLSSLVDEVVYKLRDEKVEYLTIFQSFNSLEKVAIYFILKLDRHAPSEVFDRINKGYNELSKRDTIINLLSEVPMDTVALTDVDPINGLYRMIHNVDTHEVNVQQPITFESGNIEFKEFSFPMHSYNTTKRLGGLDISPSVGVRNYYNRFDKTWLANSSTREMSAWNNAESSPIHKDKGVYPDQILVNSFSNMVGVSIQNLKNSINSYYDIFTISNRPLPMDASNEGKLFSMLGENFLDYKNNPIDTADMVHNAPLTMTKFVSPNATNSNYVNRSNLQVGQVNYSSRFKDFKTFISYYSSDINFWLTNDNSAVNNDYANYKYSNTDTNMLPSNGHVETKGYFSNIMFIQSAIQRVLYPRILKASQGGYDGYTYDNIFKSSNTVYDTIFDSIVNNGYVFTKESSMTNDDIVSNYDILPTRVTLESLYGQYDSTLTKFTNYKSTNLYEFIINNLVIGKDRLVYNNRLKMINADDMMFFNKPIGAYSKLAINYNMISDKIVTNSANTIDIEGFDSEAVSYNFGTGIYNTTGKSWFKDITDTLFKMENTKSSKLHTTKHKFFKLPVHSVSLYDKINRNIVRVDRELTTDISDLANYTIEGLSLADFTYGEKSLLKEYIEGFRGVKSIGSTVSDLEVVKLMINDATQLLYWKTGSTAINNIYYMVSDANNPVPADVQADYDRGYYDSYVDFFKGLAVKRRSAIYFPSELNTSDVREIIKFLERAYITVPKNRNNTSNQVVMEQIKKLHEFSAVNVKYINTSNGSASGRLVLDTISGKFLESMKLIIGYIQSGNDYKDKLSIFNASIKSGAWMTILSTLLDIRDILIDTDNVNDAIDEYSLYDGEEYDLLKDLDMGLYRLFIINYFNYISDSNEKVVSDITQKVMIDNNELGMIRYYNDILGLVKFGKKYHELLPKYVKYLNDNVLDKYYNVIESVKALPTWDYEHLHRRSTESQLKKFSAGVNVFDYNFVWGLGKLDINMIYKDGKDIGIYEGSPQSKYRISQSLYKGGLSNTSNDNMFRKDWWTKWIGTDGNTRINIEMRTFKIPHVEMTDQNVTIETPMKYNTPTWDNKMSLITAWSDNNRTYQKGLIGNLSQFKYRVFNTDQIYDNIGVPLLLMGDDGSEWNKANTARRKSFSFETDFWNMWHTDEGYNNGDSFNNGGGEAYTDDYKLVSGADKYNGFGLGSLDLQKVIRHLWNTESSPMGTPYNVMNHNIFPVWDLNFDEKKGNFPWSTDIDVRQRWYLVHVGGIPTGIWAYKNENWKSSNKYNFKFVMKDAYAKSTWSPVRLSDSTIPVYDTNSFWYPLFKNKKDVEVGVDPNINPNTIGNNFYLPYYGKSNVGDMVVNVYNRNLRNRIYLNYLQWRYVINKIKEVK